LLGGGRTEVPVFLVLKSWRLAHEMEKPRVYYCREGAIVAAGSCVLNRVLPVPNEPEHSPVTIGGMSLKHRLSTGHSPATKAGGH
jgi:hypothetical protein